MAKVNYNWASDVKAGVPVYAPLEKITVDGRTVYDPKDVHYRIAGYLPVVDKAPTTPATDGYHWEATSWQKETDKISRVYTEVANPPAAARRFSKLKLYEALVRRNLWEELNIWLMQQQSEEMGGNAYHAFLLANDLAEDHPLFEYYLTQVQTYLELTDEQAEAILAESVEG